MPVNPDDCRFVQTHEWVAKDDPDVQGEIWVLGISQFAIDQLTDVTVLELPALGKIFGAKASLGVIETVKSVSDIYVPVECEICEVNESLISDPEKLLKEAYGDAWIVKIRPADPSQFDSLMTHEKYLESVKDNH